jgi:hypothetical protein
VDGVQFVKKKSSAFASAGEGSIDEMVEKSEEIK